MRPSANSELPAMLMFLEGVSILTDEPQDPGKYTTGMAREHQRKTNATV